MMNLYDGLIYSFSYGDEILYACMYVSDGGYFFSRNRNTMSVLLLESFGELGKRISFDRKV